MTLANLISGLWPGDRIAILTYRCGAEVWRFRGALARNFTIGHPDAGRLLAEIDRLAGTRSGLAQCRECCTSPFGDLIVDSTVVRRRRRRRRGVVVQITAGRAATRRLAATATARPKPGGSPP